MFKKIIYFIFSAVNRGKYKVITVFGFKFKFRIMRFDIQNLERTLSAGVQISKNENITDHYRRYIDKEELASTLKNLGHRIIYQTESRGLAKYGNEDPVVIRIASQKAQNCRA